MQLRGTGFLDTSEVRLKCPQCRWDLTLRLGEVRRASDVKCTWCRSDIAFRQILDTALEQIEHAAGALQSSTKGTQS
jgi:hypothetical protein